MRWRGLTLRHTILLAIVAAVLVPTALLWSAEQVITRREFEPVIAQSRQATLAIVAAEAVSPVWSIDEREIAAVAERSLADPGLLAIRITERRPGAAPTLRSKTGADLDRAVRLAAPLSREGEPLGEVELWFDAGQVDRLLDERSRAMSLLVAAQVGIAALVLWWILMRRLVQPLQVLKRQASDIAANVDAAPVGWQRADELGELGHHLNEMQGQIRTLVERLQLKTAELTRTALHDGLTGLPNRRLFRELAEATLAHCARHQTRAALLFIDLDRFKAINDSMGHSAGDAVLLAVAARLSANLRSADLVCRHSGDEFLVLLRDAESYEAIAGTADRLLKALEAPVPLSGSSVFAGTSGRELTITASIGIAVYPEDAPTEEELTRLADTALYVSKSLGRARHTFYRAEFDATLKAALHLEAELRRAIEQQEFVLHYQPQIDAGSGALRGCEALIRWQHPERGLVSPAEFIPAAEQCGLIGELGALAIQQACAQIARWKLQGLPFQRVAVNVSALEFRQHRLIDTLTAAMAAHGVLPDELEIEITESVLMTDTDTTQRIVERLQGLGLQLAVDDFGTGYSSLAYLKHLRPSKIKVDRSFVRDLPDDEDDRVLVGAIVQLARALQIDVVAEGVETEAQRAFLRRIGCHALQGYLISRPQPAAGFEAFVAQATAVADTEVIS